MNHSPWRYDPLSGLGNMLAFFESLTVGAGEPLDEALTLLYIDLIHPRRYDNHNGHHRLEQSLRWLALAMQDELGPDRCFRLDGEEFAAVLHGSTSNEARRLAEQIQERFTRLTRWGEEQAHDPLHIVILQLSPGRYYEEVDVIIAMEAVMQQLRESTDAVQIANYPIEGDVDLRSTVGALIARVLELGSMLDQAATLADSDPLTGLPNSRAMVRHLQETIALAEQKHRRFALLLVDGDNLRAFNKISYAAGDEMIQQLGAVLGRGLRNGDRLARWRLGDEFLILLPDTDDAEARLVADRLVASVAATEWPLPVTISVGIALYPDHGHSLEVLVDQVEAALTTAKEQGKNRAIVYS